MDFINATTTNLMEQDPQMLFVFTSVAVFVVFMAYKLFTRAKVSEDFKAMDQKKKKEEFRNYEDSGRQERVENFYREQHTMQTVEFVKEKRDQHLKFNKCVKTVWEMAEYLDSITDDSDPDTDLTQLQHAIQTAEACRKAYPDDDWFHVAAFIHDLGKILLVDDEKLGLSGDPQWAVVGDTYPVGCRFDESNVFYKYFKQCPDWGHAVYSTKNGLYEPHCGLDNVTMSWGHDEYIYYIAKKQSTLPPPALYMLRYHSFYPWHKEGAYMHLCDETDMKMLKWVQCFNQFDLYSKNKDCPTIEEVAPYYKSKIEKYFPKPVQW